MEQQNKEKLSDKAFARLALTSIISILICISCLSATTYAWFTGSVQVDSNTLKAADECLLSVSVYNVAWETYYALYVGGNDSVVIVNGGTFTAPDSSVWRPDWGEAATDLVINGGTFNGSLIGNAGYYPSKYIAVKGGTFDEDPTAYLATGYVVSDNGDGTYTVSAAE